MEKTLRVSGVAFDFGNTLITDPFNRVMSIKGKEFQNVFYENGYDIEREEIVKVWNKTNNEVNYPFISHFYQERPVIMYALERLGIKKEDREKISSDLLVIYRNGLKMVIKNDKRNDDVREVLEFLKSRGKRIMILSNERKQSIKIMLKWSGLDKYFRFVVTSEELTMEKPDLRVFKYALNVLGMNAKDCAYVGNTVMTDIYPAKSIGMKTVLYMPEERELDKDIKPDFIIRDIRELISIIE